MAFFENAKGLGRQVEQAGPAVADAVLDNRVATFSFGDWAHGSGWRKVVFWAILSAVLALTALVLALTAAGELGSSYRWLVDTFNGGIPYTHTMRDNPFVTSVLALCTFGGLGYVLFRRDHWVPAYLLAFVVFFIGFVLGHVYW
jgi:hypothetical protein